MDDFPDEDQRGDFFYARLPNGACLDMLHLWMTTSGINAKLTGKNRQGDHYCDYELLIRNSNSKFIRCSISSHRFGVPYVVMNGKITDLYDMVKHVVRDYISMRRRHEIQKELAIQANQQRREQAAALDARIAIVKEKYNL